MKSEGIDLLKLYVNGTSEKWNAWLTDRLSVNDVNGLVDVRRRLQIGMTNLAEQKLNTDAMISQFLRWQKSIDDTIKKIHERKNPNPLYTSSDKSLHPKHLDDKRKKRVELENFLRKVGY